MWPLVAQLAQGNAMMEAMLWWEAEQSPPIPSPYPPLLSPRSVGSSTPHPFGDSGRSDRATETSHPRPLLCIRSHLTC